jgi:hypothetical protein
MVAIGGIADIVQHWHEMARSRMTQSGHPRCGALCETRHTDTGEIAIKAEANNGSFYVAVRDTLAAGICGRWNGVQKRQIGTTFASHLGGDGDTGVSGFSDDGRAADADTLVA